MNNSLGNNTVTNFARSYKFDGNGISDTGSNNATVTNGVFLKSAIGYQSQCLVWGASTSVTYTSVTYTNSYIWIYASGVWTFNKNHSSVGATALTGTSGNYYVMLRFYNRTLTESEEQILRYEGLRKFGPSNIASYPSLLSGLVYYGRAFVN